MILCVFLGVYITIVFLGACITSTPKPKEPQIRYIVESVRTNTTGLFKDYSYTVRNETFGIAKQFFDKDVKVQRFGIGDVVEHYQYGELCANNWRVVG